MPDTETADFRGYTITTQRIDTRNANYTITRPDGSPLVFSNGETQTASLPAARHYINADIAAREEAAKAA